MKMPTAEEQLMIKERVLLPLVLSVFERDCKTVTEVLKTPGPIVTNMMRAMDRITAELTSIRREMRRRGIKILDERVKSGTVHAEYIWRGNQSRLEILPELARVEVELRMRFYLGEDPAAFIRKDLSAIQLATEPPEGFVH